MSALPSGRMAHSVWDKAADGALTTAAFTDHFVVVGGDALAHRLVVELAESYAVPVVAIVTDPERDHGPQIVKLLGRGAVVTAAAAVGDDALAAADVDVARGIALLGGDDQSKIHTALRAQALNPDIRVVMAMDSVRLGESVERLLTNGVALSSAGTAAPAFVDAALRRPNTVRVGSQTLTVGVRDDFNGPDYLTVVADRIDPVDLSRMRMLPPSPGPAAQWIGAVSRTPVQEGEQAVLEFVDEQPSARSRRLPPWPPGLAATWRMLTRIRLELLFGVAAIVALAALIVTVAVGRPLGWAVYQTVLGLVHLPTADASGQTTGSWQRGVQVALALDGLLLVALVTAALVRGVRPRRDGPRLPSRRMRGHVVVVGLGDVGTYVIGLLHQRGIPVVCIERDPAAPGIDTARELDIPVLVGGGRLDVRMREARVQKSRAVLAVGDDDAANLEAVLEARALAPDLRAVLRLFDDDFAAQVHRTFTNADSRSVSYLAAPAFAAALMGREVLGTLSVYRHVVLIAEFVAEEASELVGRALREIEIPGEARVIAVRSPRAADYLWRPDPGRRIAEGDRYVLLATRTGLAHHIDHAATASHPRSTGRYRDRGRPGDPPGSQEFGIAVYLTDAAHGEAVRAAVRAYLLAVGAELVEDHDPVIGSWSWFARARRLGRAAAGSPVGHQAGTLAESLAWGPVRSRQADINLINSQAVANLVQSLDTSPSGLILIGSLLVVKNHNVPIVVMLSQDQVNALERRPALLRQPETILDDLQRVHAENEVDLDPPTLAS